MNTESSSSTVNMHEAKTNLSKLVQDALDGKRIWIARHGKPVVELRPIEQEIIRVPGIMKDVIWVAEDFDEYTAEIKELFEGSE